MKWGQTERDLHICAIRAEDKQKKIYARISWTKGSFIQAIEMCLNPSQHYLSSSLFLFLWTLSSNQNLTNISLYLFSLFLSQIVRFQVDVWLWEQKWNTATCLFLSIFNLFSVRYSNSWKKMLVSWIFQVWPNKC